MAADWSESLRRWTGAGLIDAATAERIREFESQESPASAVRSRGPVVLALTLGGMMIAAGVLLFVAAHWDELSPAMRFTLVLSMVAIFHVGGAFAASRFAALAMTLHAVGTITVGAGVFLAGQIFNMEEHWPGGVMLWFIAAALAWAVLKDPAQGILTALLFPAWLASEWIVASEDVPGGSSILAIGLTLLAVTYLSARSRAQQNVLSRGLQTIGGLFLIPCIVGVILTARNNWERGGVNGSTSFLAFGFILAYALPIGMAVWLRRSGSRWNFCAALWVLLLHVVSLEANPLRNHQIGDLGIYAWCALGAVALAAWGIVEGQTERVNLGVAGFALTVLIFYFDGIWDKLGRAASLISLGVLFLYGGWALERMRRKLVARAVAVSS